MSQRRNDGGVGVADPAPAGSALINLLANPEHASPELAGAGEENAPTRAANAIPEQRILDAAYTLLLAVGMKRLTMADIARAADVSRATLYRRWPNVRAVVAALVTRDLGALARGLAARSGTGREAVVTAVVRAVGELRVHPLIRKIVDVDPEFLIPYLFQRRGANTDIQLGLLAEALQAGQADGSIRSGDVDLLAGAVLLTAWSFTLTGAVIVPAERLHELDAELAELIDRYLRS